MSSTETAPARAEVGTNDYCRHDVARAEWPAEWLMTSVPALSDGPVDPVPVAQPPFLLGTRWAEMYAKYLEDWAKAVRRDETGLASLVSESAEAIAEVISCQIDPRRAVEVARQSVAERYREMTECELSHELGVRGLPIGGTVDERRERLIDSDFGLK